MKYDNYINTNNMILKTFLESELSTTDKMTMIYGKSNVYSGGEYIEYPSDFTLKFTTGKDKNKGVVTKAKIRKHGSENWIDLEEYNKPEDQNFENWEEE